MSRSLLPTTFAIADGWRRGRSRRPLLLENRAWHSLDGHTLVEGYPVRPADLDARSVPEAYEQASTCAGTSMAEGQELNDMICTPSKLGVSFSSVRAPSGTTRRITSYGFSCARISPLLCSSL